jgi:transcriptional regulator GlxA family with amidase domain
MSKNLTPKSIIPAIGIIERGSTRPPAPAAHLTNRALSFIAAEASNGIDVQDVAKHLKISRRLLDMRFKKYSQTTVAETIALRRLETAKHLLEKTTMPVKAAFKAAGFSDTTYPYRLFKKKTGISPSKWRRTAIGKE